MKTPLRIRWLIASLLGELIVGHLALAQETDPGWPRVYKQDGKQVTVYQPQVDYWHGYTNLHFRCAIAVKGVSKQEKYGVAEVDALTVTDHDARVVAIVPLKRELRFANVPESELTKLRTAVDQLVPPGQATTLSLDRVIAYLNPATEPVQRPADLNLEPPKIFSSTTPALLLMFMGEPQFRPVETNRNDLLFAVNANWDVLYDTASQRYYLLDGESWLATPDVLNGPWAAAATLPPSLYSLPDNETWAETRVRVPGKPAKVAPNVFVTTEPAELIVTEGPPNFVPIRGTTLFRVANTDSVLFLDTGDGKLYFLVAGRWFRSGSLNGPWSAASQDLPKEFAKIPDDDPSAFVKASVPGTREAKDAVLLASIPETTTVTITNVAANVTYAGAPQFVTITNTIVQYAVNTPDQVFLVSGKYYWCSHGVWYYGASAIGPWSFCASVPAAIYTIPPSSPMYNVTYVTVQSTTPTTVVYSHTSGYSGQYVAATGVLMFGAGLAVGAIIANNHHHYYYPPPCHYSYGWGACYHHGYGGYYSRGGAVYGPYGGAGFSAGYNPHSGTYTRSGYAYGPYGSASRTASYNPYTGQYSRSTQVNTRYGSAGRYGSYNASSGTYSGSAYRSSANGSASRSAAYNAQTGARAAGGQVNTAYGSAGRGAAYNPSTGQGAAAGYRSGQYGSAGGVTTTGGGKAAGWNTQSGQGAVGRSSSGDVYAAKDGTVYKKDANGNWSQNGGSGWESASKPQTQARTSSTSNRPTQTGSYQQQRSGSGTSSASSNWSQNRQTMEAQAQARSWGNQQTRSAQSWQGSGGSRSSGSNSRTLNRSAGGVSRGGRR